MFDSIAGRGGFMSMTAIGCGCCLRRMRLDEDRLWLAYCRGCGFKWEMGFSGKNRKCKCGSWDIEVVKLVKGGYLTIWGEEVV